MGKLYLKENVLTAARNRIATIFDRFEHIHVSISAGKDSTALFHLCLQEAVRRNQKIYAFFLDQEAEYEATIVLMRQIMNHPNIIPMWYQVPIEMTNATSFVDDMLYAWGEGQSWMRPKEPNSIHAIGDKYPPRFYPFFEWFEKTRPDNSAFFVGIRAEESLNRFRAIAKNPGVDEIMWSTKSKNKTSFRFYPIYDWGMGDIWKFIDEEKLPYNQIYDKMYQRNNSFYHTMRVSNLIHEKSFTCLTDLQELEPDTFEKIIKRIKGTHVASIYAKENYIFSANKLPEKFAAWLEYRNFLIETIPEKHRKRFVDRFANQVGDEYTYRQQCKQLLINDWENNISITKKKDVKIWKEKWMKIL